MLSRRLRAILGVYHQASPNSQIKALRKPVKFLTKKISPIRSLDVSWDLLQVRLRRLDSERRRHLQIFGKALQKFRLKQRQRLPAIADGFQSKLRKFEISRLAATLRHIKVLPSLQLQVKVAHRKAQKALLAYKKRPKIARLHEFRIQLKKLRYLLEVRGEVLQRQDPNLASLKKLQDHMGAIHDLEVLRQLLQDPQICRRIGGKKSRQIRDVFADELDVEILSLEKSFLSRHRHLLKSLFSREVL